MKKLLLLLTVSLSILFSADAQTDTQAKAILAAVSKKYRSYDVVKTDFTFTLDNQQANIKESKKGTLYVKAKTNKYKVTMTDQDLFSDGKSQWSYLKEDKEVQVTNVDYNSDALNPAKIFTVFENGFKSLYTGDKKVGNKVYQIIDLTPVDTKKSYYKIRLSIDKAAKQIADALIFDKNGNKYTYVINTFVPNVKVPETIFAFDARKYPDVEVVDLR